MWIVVVNYAESANKNNTATIWTIKDSALSYAENKSKETAVRDVLVFEGEAIEKFEGPSNFQGRKNSRQYRDYIHTLDKELKKQKAKKAATLEK